MEYTNINPALVLPLISFENRLRRSVRRYDPYAVDLSKRRKWYDDDPDLDDDKDKDDPDGDEGKNKKDSDDDGDDPDDDKKDEKWMNRRVSRAKKQAKSQMVKDLGFKNITELQAFINATNENNKDDPDDKDDDKKPDSSDNKSPEPNPALEELEKTNQRMEKLSLKLKNAALRNWLKSQEGLDDKTVLIDVFNLMNSDQHKEEFEDLVGEDGIANEQGLGDLLEAIRTSRPRWFQPVSPGSRSNNNGKNNNQPDAKALKEAASKMGKHVRSSF